MTAPTDRQRRPLYVDRVNERFFADPLIGNGVWPEVRIVPGMFADAPANTLFGRYSTNGQPSFLSADVSIDLINTATTQQIFAARVVAASLSGAGVVQLTDSVTSESTTTAAVPKSVKKVYDEALLKAGGVMSGPLAIGNTGSLLFEGSSDDDFETVLSVENPTADHTIRLPNRSGDVVTTGDTGTVTSTMVADGTLMDGDINSNAGITHSKLAAMSSAQVLLGNSSNIPTSTAVTGDVTISSTGVTAISSGVIVNDDVKSDAAIAHSKLASITAGQLLLGNASNVPTATAMSGDATISSSGVVAVNTTALDLFTSSTAGIVAGSGGGTANFLRADGNWAAPALTGGQTGSAPLFGVRAWGRITSGKTATPSITGGNVASVARTDEGKYSVTFTTAMASDSYAVLLTVGSDNDHVAVEKSKSTTGFTFDTCDAGTGNNDLQDTEEIYLLIIQ